MSVDLQLGIDTIALTRSKAPPVVAPAGLLVIICIITGFFRRGIYLV
jgi:hypothetical protein